MHFGCRISHPEGAKLTRENYAAITDFSRKNSLQKYRLPKASSIHEINKKYYYFIKPQILTKYNREKELYLNLRAELKDTDKRVKMLNEFIKQEIELRIEQEKNWNTIFNIESPYIQNQEFGKKYASVLNKNKIDKNCDNKIRERFLMYSQEIKKIKDYTEMDILWMRLPEMWKKWYRENPQEHTSFNIPSDWIEEYIMENAPYYTDKKCQRLQEKALENFDNNMRYFSTLNSEEFNEEINQFLKSHSTFKQVDDLRKYDGIPGVYIMVLDEYKQIYIGITRAKLGIKGRIQAHWHNVKPLDRLIWGSSAYSILCIDSFRAYDTTRIFVEPHPDFKEQVLDENGNPKKRDFMGISCNVWGKDEYLASKEFDLIENAFSQKFLCNRCAGGGRSIENAIASIKGHELCDESKDMLEATKNNLHSLL